MRISEIFRSRQGEGRLTGVESVFVRVSGCHLRCRYCDTPYASWSPEGEERSVEAIFEAVRDQGSGIRDQWSRKEKLQSLIPNPQSLTPNPSFAGHVVLTGGEPMLFEELVPLAVRFREAGWHITVETSGTRYLPVACDLMSISPKLSNAMPSEPDSSETRQHLCDRHAPHVIRRLAAEYDCQWKFVVAVPDDCREVSAYLDEFPEIERRRVMLMPQGVDAAALAETAAWLAPYCNANNVAFCPRRQIEWFGNRRGT